MTQPDLARLEGLIVAKTMAANEAAVIFVDAAIAKLAPALLARVRELSEALERIASEHIRLPDQPHGHIWHRDCDACNARQLAQDTLNRSIPDADR